MGQFAYSQKQQEIVYLKNGSVIRGTVIEQVPNKSIKVQTADGSIFVYQMNILDFHGAVKRFAHIVNCQ